MDAVGRTLSTAVVKALATQAGYRLLGSAETSFSGRIYFAATGLSPPTR